MGHLTGLLPTCRTDGQERVVRSFEKCEYKNAQVVVKQGEEASLSIARPSSLGSEWWCRTGKTPGIKSAFLTEFVPALYSLVAQTRETDVIHNFRLSTAKVVVVPSELATQQGVTGPHRLQTWLLFPEVKQLITPVRDT